MLLSLLGGSWSHDLLLALSPGCGSSWLHHTPGGATKVTNTMSRGHWGSVAREPPALGLTPCTKN